MIYVVGSSNAITPQFKQKVSAKARRITMLASTRCPWTKLRRKRICSQQDKNVLPPLKTHCTATTPHVHLSVPFAHYNAIVVRARGSTTAILIRCDLNIGDVFAFVC